MEAFDYLLRILLILFSIYFAHHLGFNRGLEQGRQLRQEEIIEGKENLVNSILSEIVQNESLLNKGWTKNPKAPQYPQIAFWYLLKRDSYTAALSSDTILSLSPRTQIVLKDYYSEVDRMILLVNKLDGVEVTTKIGTIRNEQTPLMAALKNTSRDLKLLLNKDINK
jgi:hypothetical protein